MSESLRTVWTFVTVCAGHSQLVASQWDSDVLWVIGSGSVWAPWASASRGTHCGATRDRSELLASTLSSSREAALAVGVELELEKLFAPS